jgi:hypothetical protein
MLWGVWIRPALFLIMALIFLLVQIYVDDIIFGDSSHTLVSRFQEMMESEF